MAEVHTIVKELSDKYGRTRESLIPILQGIMQAENYLSVDAMRDVAMELDISAADVYGTASFYAFLDIEPRGKYTIRVCRSITCDMKNKKAIVKTIEEMLKIKLGETSKGNRFTLLETNCIGWCHKGPAMLINDEVHTELTPLKVREILQDYIRNK